MKKIGKTAAKPKGKPSKAVAAARQMSTQETLEFLASQGNAKAKAALAKMKAEGA